MARRDRGRITYHCLATTTRITADKWRPFRSLSSAPSLHFLNIVLRSVVRVTANVAFARWFLFDVWCACSPSKYITMVLHRGVFDSFTELQKWLEGSFVNMNQKLKTTYQWEPKWITKLFYIRISSKYDEQELKLLEERERWRQVLKPTLPILKNMVLGKTHDKLYQANNLNFLGLILIPYLEIFVAHKN